MLDLHILGLCPNAIWGTYGAPDNLYLEYLLVSLFSLTPPPVKKHFAGPDQTFKKHFASPALTRNLIEK